MLQRLLLFGFLLPVILQGPGCARSVPDEVSRKDSERTAPSAPSATVATTRESPPAPLWASELGSRAGEERSNKALGMKMMWCPPGKFLMGSPATDTSAISHEKPQVETELTGGFWLGKYEVMQGEWKELMGTEPWKGQKYAKEGSEYAATFVSWSDADSFCKKLTEREISAGRGGSGWVYRLPSEAEWEYACRAGSVTRYCFGEDTAELSHYAWYVGNTNGESYAHPVGQKRSNAWGLHDMHGNVSEWCGDWCGDELPGGVNPTGPSTGSLRVYRGGCWSIVAGYCRSAARAGHYPSFRDYFLGFRVARVPVRSR